MRKQSAPKEKNSLKTVFFFLFCVFLLIVISLVVKTILMVRVSKFDGVNQFIVVVEKRGQVLGIASFDPGSNATSVLEIKNRVGLSGAAVGKSLGVLPDGVVDAEFDAFFDFKNSAGMGTVVWHFTRLKTQLTLYDAVRFFLLAKGVPLANRRLVSISFPMDDAAVDKVVSRLFSDSAISAENLSIQVVNASGAAGVGNRLARIFTNMGGNVVSVISAQRVEGRSTISYFGKKSYTLVKLSRLLKYPVERVAEEGIADIVVTIGKDGNKGF